MGDAEFEFETLDEEQERRRKGTWAHFYQRPVQDEQKSLEEGRPICVMKEYIKIQIPGDRTVEIDTPANPDHKKAYPRQYLAFKANKDQDAASGTLIAAWGGVPPERAEEYKLMKIRTVEQLSEVSDANLQRLGPGALGERQRARDYVAAMKGAAPTLKLRKELEERDEKIAVLERNLKELGDKFEASQRKKGA